jgi:A/G-specific adenine glycosylase
MIKANRAEFLRILQANYRKHGRHDLPWRQPEPDCSFDPYKILVSEIMLQQTQVPRVITKYREFLTAFPTIETLAAAELGQVLRLWSGLGYNRRAKYLHETAKAIAALGYFPNSITELVKLPGIGKNTAGAIVAYAFNRPVVFVETNVRTVYIHHFFADQINIPDSQLIEQVEQTLDKENPREFYWSVMDYGSHLKKEIGNINKLSKHYSKQSKFHGSRRQIRGQVLKLLNEKQLALAELATMIPDERLTDVLQELVSEGLVRQAGKLYRL